MSFINHGAREINCKLVYYGPGYCGKTTNLEYIHAHARAKVTGKLVTLATDTDRTLFFDFLPLTLGEVAGFRVRFHLYTVPGQVFYRATRKLVLRGVDGLVFVADSQPGREEANRESMEDLREDLAAYGVVFGDLPMILQCNKQDVHDAASVAEIVDYLGFAGSTTIGTSAHMGLGVFETLRELSKLVLRRLQGPRQRG